MAFVDPGLRASSTLRTAARALRERAVVAVGLVMVVVLGAGVGAGAFVADHTTDARAVNVSGRQRMLSQRIVGAALLATEGDVAARERLMTAQREFTAAHEALVAGDGRLGIERPLTPEMEAHYLGADGLQEQVAWLDRSVDRLLAAPDGGATDTLLDEFVERASGPLLASLDHAVSLDEAAVAEQLEGARARLLLGSGVALLALLGLALALFRPLHEQMLASSDVLERWEDDDVRRQQWQREFAGIASHELRTPVTILSGLGTTLSRHWTALADDTRQDLVGRMGRAAAGLSELLDELNVVAGLAAPGDRSVVWPLADLAPGLAERAGVEVEVAHRCWVDLDRGRTALLLRELVDNAVAHGGAPVSVWLGPVPGTAAVELRVHDRGAGIDLDELDRLLLPFGRGTAVDRHTSVDGHGLGLAMVRAVVDEAGGTMEWEPADPGGAWRVRLPAAVVPAPVATVVPDVAPDVVDPLTTPGGERVSPVP